MCDRPQMRESGYVMERQHCGKEGNRSRARIACKTENLAHDRRCWHVLHDAGGGCCVRGRRKCMGGVAQGTL